MGTHLRSRLGVMWIAGMLVAVGTTSAGADEIWVAPTSQSDLGGLGVASNAVWPVTPVGAVRLAWAIPDNLVTFQSAKLALIPSTAAPAATLTLFLCPAQGAQVVTASCAGPFTQAFTSIANQLLEIDISAAIGAHLGTPGASYLSALAFTAPTTTTDHIVGLRFTYASNAKSCVDNTNRYVDCGNGTVTDTATGLTWLKQWNCLGGTGTDWAAATQAAAALKTGDCGLTDQSSAGDWRLPTEAEWITTVTRADALSCSPSLTNDAGTACYSTGASSFTGLSTSDAFWTSTGLQIATLQAWYMFIGSGSVISTEKISTQIRVWPVRGGRQ
jgi:hypothetical protein